MRFVGCLEVVAGARERDAHSIPPRKLWMAGYVIRRKGRQRIDAPVPALGHELINKRLDCMLPPAHSANLEFLLVAGGFWEQRNGSESSAGFDDLESASLCGLLSAGARTYSAMRLTWTMLRHLDTRPVLAVHSSKHLVLGSKTAEQHRRNLPRIWQRLLLGYCSGLCIHRFVKRDLLPAKAGRLWCSVGESRLDGGYGSHGRSCRSTRSRAATLQTLARALDQLQQALIDRRSESRILGRRLLGRRLALAWSWRSSMCRHSTRS